VRRGPWRSQRRKLGPVTAERSFLKDLRIVLQGRDFRRLFAVRLSSQASDGAFQVGLASLVFFSPERQATPAAAAAAAIVTLLPYTLLGPFAGVLLDVWPRRQILLVANAVRSLMVVLVAALVLAGSPVAWLYAVALACLSLNRFFLAGLGASLPKVVPHDELVMANAVSPTSGTVAAILGASVGYLPRLVLGDGDDANAIILLLAAAGYAGSAALATRMPRHLLGPDVPAPLSWSSMRSAGRDVLHDMRDGARHVRQRRPAAHALAVIGAHRVGYGLMTISLMLLCRNHFSASGDVDAGLALLGQAVVATGAGIGAAAFLTPIAVARLGPQRWIGACIAGAGLIQFSLVAVFTWPAALVAAFALGLTGQAAKICVDSVVQESVDDAFRGRVFAFYDVIFNAAFVTAALIALVGLPDDGYARAMYAGIAVVDILAASLYLLRSGAATTTQRPHAPHSVDRMRAL
jgi:MFS family permease